MKVGALGERIVLAEQGDVYVKIFFRIIPFLLFCYICSYLDRINVGFAKLQMVDDLHFSETAYGLGAGIFFIGYFLFEVPSNLIMMRTGARFWIGRIMISWGLVSAAMIFARTETSFYLLRFLLGIAEAGFIPGVLYYLNCWFPAKAKGRATALFMAGIPLAGMIGGPLSGFILSRLNGVAGLSGWKWMFLIEAAPTILAGIGCFLWLDSTPDRARWLTDAEKASIALDHERETAAKMVHTFREGALNGTVWALSALYSMFTFGLYAVSFWLPSIIAQTGVKDPAAIGMLTAIPFTAALVVMYLVGRSSDRRRERRWHLLVPAFMGAAGLAFSVMFHDNMPLTVGGLTVATAGIITCVPQFYVIPPLLLSGGAAAAGFAVINSIGNLAGFVSPYLLGYVKDATGSTAGGMLIVAGCLLIGGSCSLLVRQRGA